MRHHVGTRARRRRRSSARSSARADASREPRSLVFTDTFSETNGVAGTMRRLAAAAAEARSALSVVTADDARATAPGLIRLEADWSLPLPAYERLALNFPLLTEGARARRGGGARPDPRRDARTRSGSAALAAAKLLGLPLVGSYHTELGPYALHLTRDAVVADAFSLYVDWFYRQCDTRARADPRGRRAARGAGLPGRVAHLGPRRRHDALHARAPLRGAPRARCSAAARRCCSRSAASPTRSGSTSCSTRSILLGRMRRACGSWSPATARRGSGSSAGAATGRQLPRRAPRRGAGARSTRAPTSSASRARPTPSARCCSRRARAGCRSSPPRPAARRSSSRTASAACSSHPTIPWLSPRRHHARVVPVGQDRDGRAGA